MITRQGFLIILTVAWAVFTVMTIYFSLYLISIGKSFEAIITSVLTTIALDLGLLSIILLRFEEHEEWLVGILSESIKKEAGEK